LQTDRRVVHEGELSDSEDEDGDKRRNHSNAKQLSQKRKASVDSVHGIYHSYVYILLYNLFNLF
jgi:hypothetical protein